MHGLERESRLAVRNWNPYRRGRRFEYRTRDHLRKQGWFVVRQPQSSSPDLIALRDGSILLVECKLGGYIPKAERRHIISLAKRQVGGRAVLAFRRGRKLVLKELSSRWAGRDKLFDPSIECTGGKNSSAISSQTSQNS